jgi:hypothetical protein
MNSDAELKFVSSKFARNESFSQIRDIRGDHLCPTWGDLDKVNKIVGGINPSNARQLLTGFGAVVLARDLQIVRNACAHVSPDKIREIRALSIRYRVTELAHPSDVIFWIDASTGATALEAWSDELNSAASLAVS